MKSLENMSYQDFQKLRDKTKTFQKTSKNTWEFFNIFLKKLKICKVEGKQILFH